MDLNNTGIDIRPEETEHERHMLPDLTSSSQSLTPAQRAQRVNHTHILFVLTSNGAH